MRSRWTDHGLIATTLLGWAALLLIEAGTAGAEATSQRAGNVSTARLAAEAKSGENWLVKGGRLTGEHFSPLDQIRSDNIEKLGLAWAADIASPIGLVSEPLVVDGVVYLSAPLSVVHALDASTGKHLWTFDPKVNPQIAPASSIATRFNRGVAVWKGAVIVGTGDCRLVAIDAAKGTQLWDQQACDPMNGVARGGGGAGITGAPLVADDKIFIGYLGAEAGARGSIGAFDAATGKPLWRFWTVPGDPAGPAKGLETEELRRASKTWSGGWAQIGGGGVWDAIHYDPETGFVIFGTGSPMPHPLDQRGEGDALFTNSVIAVDAKTGAYKWHYQTVPEDAWDYDATMPKIVTDVEVGGKKRHVVFEAGKSGFFYVLDARTGELLSADAIAKITWASHVDMKTGRPVPLATGRYWESKDPKGPAPVFPSSFGARNWEPMAYSPLTGLVYMPVADMSTPFSTVGYPGGGVDTVGLGPDEPTPANRGRLLAWDPIKREKRWSYEHRVPYNGGVLVTAGNVVFQGTGTGKLEAFDAQTGKRLWSRATGSSIQAAPVTYRIGQDQYVLVTIGTGGGMRLIINRIATTPDAGGPARVLAFKLGGTAEIPIAPVLELAVPKPPPRRATPEQLVAADDTWVKYDCQTCHGGHAMALGKVARGGAIPDLRYSPLLYLGWDEVVLGGALEAQGMPSFKRVFGMTEEDSEAIRGYVIEQAWKAYEKQQGANNATSKQSQRP